MKHPNDDVIFDKLRRSLKDNTPKTGIRGNWFTGAECVRLLEMLKDPREAAPRKMPVPVGTVTVADGGLTIQFDASAGLIHPGHVLDLYRRESGPNT